MLKIPCLLRVATLIDSLKLLTVAFILAICLTSCSLYGPPEVRANIVNVRAKPNSHIFAAAILYEVIRPGIGIAAEIPDSGITTILKLEGKFYLCNADSGSVKKLAVLPVKKDVAIYFEPFICGWQQDSVYFRISGQPGTSVKDYARKTDHFYCADNQGNISSVSRLPENLEYQPETGPTPGQGQFLRVSKGYNTIAVGNETSPQGEWEATIVLTSDVFKLDPKTGDLIKVREIESRKREGNGVR